MDDKRTEMPYSVAESSTHHRRHPMALSIQFTSTTVKRLAAAWQQARRRGDQRPLPRITALQMLGQRQAVAAVAACVGVAESTLYGWLSAFLLHGLASLAYRSSPGRPA